MGKLWTPEDVALLREQYPLVGAQSLRETAFPYRTTACIRAKAHELGVTAGRRGRRKRQWSPEEDALLAQHFDSGTLEQIQETHFPHLTPNAVNKRGKELGLYRTQKRHKGGHPKYSHNDSFFSVPNDLNSYWAGFLAADGFVYHPTPSTSAVGVRLNVADYDHLEQFRRDTAFTGEVKLNSHKTNFLAMAHYAVLRVYGADRWVADLWGNFGVGQNKSLTIEPPPLTDKSHQLAFIRGLIDGDGSISRHPNTTGHIQISLVGNAPLLEWVNTIWQSIAPSARTEGRKVMRRKGKSDSFGAIHIAGKGALTVGEALLIPPGPRLARKWDYFIEARDRVRGHMAA